MKSILFYICILIFIIILSIIVIAIYRKARRKPNNKTWKIAGVFIFCCVSVASIKFYIDYSDNVERMQELQKQQEKNKLELATKNSKDAKYVNLLESSKSYEELDEDQKTTLEELLTDWINQDEKFKEKYKAQKEFLENSKIYAEAKMNKEKLKNEHKETAIQAEDNKESYNTGITYDQLARTPDEYIAKKVTFTGQVVQTLDDDNVTYIRLAVNNNSDNIILGSYDSNISNVRILGKDNVTILGVSNGITSYESTIGKKITIPKVSIDSIELNK